MSTIRYCDMKDCGVQIHSQGLRAKVMKGSGDLAGGDLDLCSEHREAVERFIRGDKPDQAQPLPSKPRSPKPRGGTRPAA